MTASTVRVIFQQPSLAKYRVPFFRSLAAVKDIELEVIHGKLASLPNSDPDGFASSEVLEKSWFGSKILWHSVQWTAASKKQCDVLVLSANPRYLSLLLGLLRARLSGVAVILWGHHRSKSDGGLVEFLRNKVLFKLATSVVCYSHQVADTIRQIPEFSEKTFVAPNAVDQTAVRDAKGVWNEEALSEFKVGHGLSEGPVLLFVSRIKPRNKVGQILDVLHKLQEKYPSAKAVIVGAHDEEQRRVAGKAQEMNLSKSVLFPGAIYDEEKLAPWFLSADVYLYPAQIGLSLFHSFGYGLPVVAGVHPHEQNPELEALEHGVNGFRFEDDDVEGATRCVLELIEDKALKETMQDSALETVEKRFNTKIMAACFADAIRKSYQSLKG